MTYKIAAIRAKAKRVGGRYLQLCQDLASEWNETTGLATFDDDALEEIRASVKQTPRKTCSTCRGL